MLESDQIQEEFKKKNIKTLVADLTNANPYAEALSNRLGSKSIPFLAVFPGDDPYQVYTLRDVYTIDDLMQILAQIK